MNRIGCCGRAAAAAVLLAIAGCASTPEAPVERDAEAKQFAAQPATAALYVFRPDLPADLEAMDSVLFVDRRLIGATLPGTYFRVDLRPGEHVLRGYAYDQGSLKIATRAGEIYFVRLNVENGTSRFTPVGPDAGKREIQRCCMLLENWAPGQRPLIR